MASVWYLGRADRRVISQADWVSHGVGGSPEDSVWDESNGYSLSASIFSAAQLDILDADDGFDTEAPDGPRDEPVASVEAGVSRSVRDYVEAYGNATYVRPSSIGDRLRRAAGAVKGKSSIELPVMASPPTITASTSNPNDPALTRTLHFVDGYAGKYKFRGGYTVINATNYYRFPCVTLPTGTGNADATHNANGWAVEFYADAPKFLVYGLASTSTKGYAFEVDGVRVSATRTAFASETTAPTYMLVDFSGVRQPRHIRIEGDRASGMRGVAVAPIDTVWAPKDATPLRAVFAGNSISEQTGATQPNGGYAITLGKMLGWTDVWEIAVGGTGFVTANNGSTFGHAQRITDTVTAAPDVLVLAASPNDNGVAAGTVTGAALAAFQAYRAALPSVPVIVAGCWGGATGPAAAVTTNEDAVKAAFDSWADPLSYWVPISTDPAGPWVAGTGHVGATNSSGNSDVYVNAADTTHPSQAGHDYLAKRYANAIRQIVLPNLV